MARYIIDWDGTCVSAAWPGMGEWLPGAVDALRELSEVGQVVIFTCRTAPFEVDEITPRPAGAQQEEVNGIRAMLDMEGLHAVQVWMNPWKPGGIIVDNNAVRFNGRKKAWPALVLKLKLMTGVTPKEADWNS